MTNRVSEKDARSNIDKIFSLFDSSKTGGVTYENLKEAATTLGENCGDAELKEMFQRADVNGDGVIDADEFYEIMTRPLK